MASRIENYEKILKKYGISLSKEKLLELINSIDQLAECFLNFERNSHKNEHVLRTKESISRDYYLGRIINFLKTR